MKEPLRKCIKCGLEAWMKEDLELFKKGKQCKYGRLNFCKKCRNDYERNNYVRKLRPPYFRKCRVCGLEANNVDELNLFRKGTQKDVHGYQNICLRCSNKEIRNRYKKNKSRHFHHKSKNELLQIWGRPLICRFCGKEITKLHGQDSDSLAIHSLDGNHNNWEPENKVPRHMGCHAKIHHDGRIHSDSFREKLRKIKSGKNAYNWQGNKASKQALYCREWRKRNPDYAINYRKKKKSGRKNHL